MAFMVLSPNSSRVLCLPVARKLVNEQIELRPDHFFLTFTFTFTGKTMADAAQIRRKRQENSTSMICISCDFAINCLQFQQWRWRPFVYKQLSPEEKLTPKGNVELSVEAVGNAARSF
jgi:hypothetical protein